ncbi:MAG: hypothetical protein AMJ46_05000 [Latescibacteria bacterium DG_63]|nr:MAG: hypothetical protein AMJ46_05000 [Latescibacteria bacterium DG_63]
MRDRLFDWIGRVTYQRYWLVLLVSLPVTLFLGSLAAGIRVEATWMSLLPRNSQSVKSFQTILDEFGAATNIILALEGPDKASITRAAEEIVPELGAVTIWREDSEGNLVSSAAFRRIEHKYDLDFVKRHGLMLEKAKNLDKNAVLFTDYNVVPFLTHMNDVYEQQWVGDSDNLTKQEKDAERSLDGAFQLFYSMSDFTKGKTADPAAIQEGVDALTVGDGYYLSSDKRMLLIFITPSMSVNEIELAVAAVDSLELWLTRLISDHPGVHFGLTGMHVVTRDEMHAGISDTMRNLFLAILLILAIFVLSFRMWTGPLLAMLVLLTGITWDIGIVRIVVGRLNIITVVCSVVLVGLGIDYAIHIISSYTELRHKGRTIEQAVSGAFRKIGNGLVTGALTTAVAFFSLAAIGSSAFGELGFVVGTGIVCCLLSSIFLLPAAIVAKEKLWGLATRKEHPARVDMEFRFLGRLTELVTSRPWMVVMIAATITVFLMFQIPKARMNENYMDLEPEGLESIRLQREIVKRFHMSPDNMMAIYESTEEVERVQDHLNSMPIVGMAESIATVLPSAEKQSRRLPYIKDIREAQARLPGEAAIETAELAEELRRLSDNVIEISSLAYTSGLDRVFDKANEFVGLDEKGDQVGVNHAEELADYLERMPEAARRLETFQRHFRKMMKNRIAEMSSADVITLNDVPDSYRERYVSKDGSHFLVTFYSRRDIWDGLFTSPFLDTMLRKIPNATGSPVFMKEMVEASGREGRLAFVIALATILVLLLLDFRSPRAALVAVTPLLMSAVWLFGLMGLFGIKFTIVNVIGFPLLIGIGIDDGVHVLHRYRVEGRANLAYTVSSIGKAILLTSLTTMLGFGSLMSSDYRGYVGLGLIVTMGIGLCFITSVVVLPAILKIVWGGRVEHPGFFRDRQWT